MNVSVQLSIMSLNCKPIRAAYILMHCGSEYMKIIKKKQFSIYFPANLGISIQVIAKVFEQAKQSKAKESKTKQKKML